MVFMSEEGEVQVYERHNDVITRNTVKPFSYQDTIITFNGWRYDYPMWGALLANKTNAELKQISDDIILNGTMPWVIEKRYGIEIPPMDHIDIINVLPLTASLKIYGGRINFPKLQDLPLDPSAIITAEDAPLMRKYCGNDCQVTWALTHKVQPQIEVREKMGIQYGLDLRSKSDAQIAEAVIASEYVKITGTPLYKPDSVKPSYKYDRPEFIDFKGPTLSKILGDISRARFTIKPSNGQVEEPDELKQVIEIDDKKYKMGIGGLHSVDEPGSVTTNEEHFLVDIDVASYYPRIILNGGYYPDHMGTVFLEIYENIVTKRLAAKASGDDVTNAALKIVINGTFGKFGSMYSKIYAPRLMFHTTVTGQLALLMLIEEFADTSIEVLSANTDGLTLRVKHSDQHLLKILVADWEITTGFKMESTDYQSYHRRDVNNYMVITDDGKTKVKGTFAETGLSKNPANSIIYEAITAYFRNGDAVEFTIEQCNDLTKFISLRTVKGGAYWGDEILGKSVRWYHSWLSAIPIQYRTNDKKVPLTDGTVPLMDLPEQIPYDLNRQWYIDEANKLLEKMK